VLNKSEGTKKLDQRKCPKIPYAFNGGIPLRKMQAAPFSDFPLMFEAGADYSLSFMFKATPDSISGTKFDPKIYLLVSTLF
jgi:hypothetical protein